jgi:hypothetical protein
MISIRKYLLVQVEEEYITGVTVSCFRILFESENSSDVLLHQKKYKVKTIVIPTL